jgi:hypothetical protein
MQIFVSLKNIGSKRPAIKKQRLDLGNLSEFPSLKEVIAAIVNLEVDKYNDKEAQKQLFDHLLETKIHDMADTGKVGFGTKYNENSADTKKSVDVALQAFEDGMYAVFLEEEQIESLDSKLEMNEDSILTFVRLTFLAGSIW